MDIHDITPLVLTYNEAPNIARCLERLSWAKRVVVLDSGSTDETAAIAAGFAHVDILVRAFDNHTDQWNHGLDAVETEWVLALDADYVLGDGFEKEVASLEVPENTDALNASFRYLVFGQPLKASLYPPRPVLFRKSRCRYEQDGHTQALHIKGGVGQLQTTIDHDDRKPLSRWIKAQDHYAILEANKLLTHDRSNLRIQDRLRTTGWAAVPATLIYTLFIRGTLLDGWRGWYYTLQRTLAEMLLALRLLEARLTQRNDIP